MTWSRARTPTSSDAARSRSVRSKSSGLGWVAARVVVGEYDPVRPLPDRRPERVSRRDRTLRQRSLSHLDRPEQPPADVEQDDVEGLPLGEGGVAQQLVDAPGVEAALPALRRRP